MKGKIVIDVNNCKGCGLCVINCGQKLIKMTNNLNEIGFYSAAVSDPEGKCTGCGLCYITCPDAVIEVYRERR